MKIDKIVSVCDKLKGPFFVRDVMAIGRMPDDLRTSKAVSAELHRLASRGVIQKIGKENGKNIYHARDDITTKKAFDLYFADREQEKRQELYKKCTESKSYQREHPIIPFPLGYVRMKPAAQRFFAAR